MKQATAHNCSQCGAPLIFVSEVTELREGTRFPQTTTKYRCSNDECQGEKDKQTAKRIKLLEDKAISDQKRKDEKAAEKKLLV